MATLDELRRAEDRDLTVRQRVEAFFKGTDSLRLFAEEVMVPIMTKQLDLNDRELAITGVYYRMYAWIQSLVSMNSRIHSQGAASAARTLFELLLDLKLLVSDSDGILVDRYHAFPQLDRYRVAKQIVEYNDGNPSSQIDDTHQRQLVGIPSKAEEIDELTKTHWGLTKAQKPQRPQHWSGLTVKARAQKLGKRYYELYLESYPLLSWSVHAGAANYAGIQTDALESCFGLSHAIAQRCFLEATEATATEMHIDKAVEGFRDILRELRLTPGAVIMEEQARKIDEARQRSAKGGVIIPP